MFDSEGPLLRVVILKVPRYGQRLAENRTQSEGRTLVLECGSQNIIALLTANVTDSRIGYRTTQRSKRASVKQVIGSDSSRRDQIRRLRSIHNIG